MLFCPFCRKSVESTTVWCVCGTNLSQYSSLPVATKDIKAWLTENENAAIKSPKTQNGSLVDAAKKQLIEEQEKHIEKTAEHRVEISEAEKLIADFLEDCKNESLAPTIDIGQLRRERWRQWKRIPTEYRQHPPIKDFKLTPGYLFETSIAKYKDEFCVGIDGSLYKHQLNAPDPYPVDELLRVITIEHLAVALTSTLVWLLKNKQKPLAEETSFDERIEAQTGSSQSGRVVAKRKRGLRLSLGKKKSKETTISAADNNGSTGQERVVQEAIAQTDNVGQHTTPATANNNGDEQEAPRHLEKTRG